MHPPAIGVSSRSGLPDFGHYRTNLGGFRGDRASGSPVQGEIQHAEADDSSEADETHGTGLMDELDHLFDAQVSPGTVYPRLHELDDEGILDVHELVQTKQYSISDDPTARDRIQCAVSQHLAMAMFLHASLDDV